MHDTISDHASLITSLGGAARVAEALSALPVTVRAWSARNRIPPEYWGGIIDLARLSEVDVGAEWLMNTTPARSSRPVRTAETVA